MRDNIMKEFWVKWLETDELDRVALISTLPIYNVVKVDAPPESYELSKYALATLINSYLSDLANIVEEQVKYTMDCT